MNVVDAVPALFQDQDISFSLWCAGAPDAELLVHSFAVSEQIFSLTQINVELASHDPHIDLQSILDTACTLTIHHKFEGLRHFSGVVAAASRGDEGFHRTMYSVTILPMMHRLAHGSDCRIFQQKTAVDIINQVLKESGVENVKWHLSGKNPVQTREYCVQYRESHLTFCDRIAAEEGIWHYHTHGPNGQHTLHFCDLNYIVPDLPTQPGLEYNAMAGGVVKGTFCHQFRYQELVKSTSYTQRDYYFTNPPYRQEHRYNRPEDNGAKRDYDLYDYPGRYKFDAQGKPFTQYRMEANRVDASTASGTTNAIHLMPGHNMELTAHPRDDYNIKYHLLAVSHHGSQPQALEEEAGEGGATTYSASFHAMPARLPYRPPQRHKPFVEGIQHAMVVGPEGEEIYCDEFGRVKVQFKWDRYGKNDEHSSCWVRVASHWAGTQWGHVSVPRINQEVIVGFYDGDPDQPVIIGRTYNARNQFPYKLPDNKTRMVMRSDSHKRKGRTGFNELRFEDEDGREEVYIRAEKDMSTRILDNSVSNIGGLSIENIDKDRWEFVGETNSLYVAKDYNLSVGFDRNQNGLLESLDLKDDNLQKNVFGYDSLDFSSGTTGDYRVSVKGTIFMQSNSNVCLTSEQNFRIDSDRSVNITGDEDIDFHADANCDLTSGKSTVVSAGEFIKLEVAGSSVLISKDGRVRIRAKSIEFSAEEDIDIQAGGEIRLDAKKIRLN